MAGSHAPSAPVGSGLSRVARAVRFLVLSDYGRYAFGAGLRQPLPHHASSAAILPRRPAKCRRAFRPDAPEPGASGLKASYRGWGYWVVVSRFSRSPSGCSPWTRNQVFSAILVAWSPMRSMFLAMNSRWVQAVIWRGSSAM